MSLFIAAKPRLMYPLPSCSSRLYFLLWPRFSEIRVQLFEWVDKEVEKVPPLRIVRFYFKYIVLSPPFPFPSF